MVTNEQLFPGIRGRIISEIVRHFEDPQRYLQLADRIVSGELIPQWVQTDRYREFLSNHFIGDLDNVDTISALLHNPRLVALMVSHPELEGKFFAVFNNPERFSEFTQLLQISNTTQTELMRVLNGAGARPFLASMTNGWRAVINLHDRSAGVIVGPTFNTPHQSIVESVGGSTSDYLAIIKQGDRIGIDRADNERMNPDERRQQAIYGVEVLLAEGASPNLRFFFRDASGMRAEYTLAEVQSGRLSDIVSPYALISENSFSSEPIVFTGDEPIPTTGMILLTRGKGTLEMRIPNRDFHDEQTLAATLIRQGYDMATNVIIRKGVRSDETRVTLGELARVDRNFLFSVGDIFDSEEGNIWLRFIDDNQVKLVQLNGEESTLSRNDFATRLRDGIYKFILPAPRISVFSIRPTSTHLSVLMKSLMDADPAWTGFIGMLANDGMFYFTPDTQAHFDMMRRVGRPEVEIALKVTYSKDGVWNAGETEANIKRFISFLIRQSMPDSTRLNLLISDNQGKNFIGTLGELRLVYPELFPKVSESAHSNPVVEDANIVDGVQLISNRTITPKKQDRVLLRHTSNFSSLVGFIGVLNDDGAFFWSETVGDKLELLDQNQLNEANVHADVVYDGSAHEWQITVEKEHLQELVAFLETQKLAAVNRFIVTVIDGSKRNVITVDSPAKIRSFQPQTPSVVQQFTTTAADAMEAAAKKLKDCPEAVLPMPSLIVDSEGTSSPRWFGFTGFYSDQADQQKSDYQKHIGNRAIGEKIFNSNIGYHNDLLLSDNTSVPSSATIANGIFVSMSSKNLFDDVPNMPGLIKTTANHPDDKFKSTPEMVSTNVLRETNPISSQSTTPKYPSSNFSLIPTVHAAEGQVRGATSGCGVPGFARFAVPATVRLLKYSAFATRNYLPQALNIVARDAMVDLWRASQQSFNPALQHIGVRWQQAVTQGQQFFGGTSSSMDKPKASGDEQFGFSVEIPGDSSRVTLGRDGDRDISIGDPSVSRNHGEIIVDHGTYYYENRGFTNGSFVNDVSVLTMEDERIELKSGDTIQLGRAQVQFVFTPGKNGFTLLRAPSEFSTYGKSLQERLQSSGPDERFSKEELQGLIDHLSIIQQAARIARQIQLQAVMYPYLSHIFYRGDADRWYYQGAQGERVYLDADQSVQFEALRTLYGELLRIHSSLALSRVDAVPQDGDVLAIQQFAQTIQLSTNRIGTLAFISQAITKNKESQEPMARQYGVMLIRIRNLWEAALIYPENFDQILRSEFQETPEVAEEILDYMHGKLNNTPVGEDFDRMFTNESQSYDGVVPQGVIRGLLLAEQGMIRQFLPQNYQDYYRQSLQELNAQMRAAGMTEFEGSRYVKKGEDAWYFNLNLRHETYRAHGNSDGFVSVTEPIRYTKVLSKDVYARFIAHTKTHEMLHQLLDGMVGINRSSYGPDSTEEAFVELYARLLSGADPSEFTGYYDLRTHRLYQLVQEAAQVKHMTPARVLSEILKSMKKGYITITRALNRYLPEYCEGKCPSLPAGTTYLQYMDGYMDAPGDRKLSPDEAENLTSITPIIGSPYLFNRALEDKIQNLNSVPLITAEQFRQLSHDDQILEYSHMEQMQQVLSQAENTIDSKQTDAKDLRAGLTGFRKQIEILYTSLPSPYHSDRSLVTNQKPVRPVATRLYGLYTDYQTEFRLDDLQGLSIPGSYETPRKVIDVARLLSDPAYRQQIIILLLKLGELYSIDSHGDMVPSLEALDVIIVGSDTSALNFSWDTRFLPVFSMLLDLRDDLLAIGDSSSHDDVITLLGVLTDKAMKALMDHSSENYSYRQSSEKIPRLVQEGRVQTGRFGKHDAYLSKEEMLLRVKEFAEGQNPVVTREDHVQLEQILRSFIRKDGQSSPYEKLRNQNVASVMGEIDGYVRQNITLDTLFALLAKLRVGITSDPLVLRDVDLQKIKGRKDVVPFREVPARLDVFLARLNGLQTMDIDTAARTAAEMIADFQDIHPIDNFSGRLGHVLANIALAKMGQGRFFTDPEENIVYVDSVTAAISGDFTKLIAFIRAHLEETPRKEKSAVEQVADDMADALEAAAKKIKEDCPEASLPTPSLIADNTVSASLGGRGFITDIPEQKRNDARKGDDLDVSVDQNIFKGHDLLLSRLTVPAHTFEIQNDNNSEEHAHGKSGVDDVAHKLAIDHKALRDISSARIRNSIPETIAFATSTIVPMPVSRTNELGDMRSMPNHPAARFVKTSANIVGRINENDFTDDYITTSAVSLSNFSLIPSVHAASPEQSRGVADGQVLSAVSGCGVPRYIAPHLIRALQYTARFTRDDLPQPPNFVFWNAVQRSFNPALQRLGQQWMQNVSNPLSTLGDSALYLKEKLSGDQGGLGGGGNEDTIDWPKIKVTESDYNVDKQHKIKNRINQIRWYLTEVMGIPQSSLPLQNVFQLVDNKGFRQAIVDSGALSDELSRRVTDEQRAQRDRAMKSLGVDTLVDYAASVLYAFVDPLTRKAYINLSPRQDMPVIFSAPHEYMHLSGHYSKKVLTNGHTLVQFGVSQIEYNENGIPIQKNNYFLNEQINELVHLRAQQYAGYSIPGEYQAYSDIPDVTSELFDIVDPSGDILRTVYLSGDLSPVKNAVNNNADLVRHLKETGFVQTDDVFFEIQTLLEGQNLDLKSLYQALRVYKRKHHIRDYYERTRQFYFNNPPSGDGFGGGGEGAAIVQPNQSGLTRGELFAQPVAEAIEVGIKNVVVDPLERSADRACGTGFLPGRQSVLADGSAFGLPFRTGESKDGHEDTSQKHNDHSEQERRVEIHSDSPLRVMTRLRNQNVNVTTSLDNITSPFTLSTPMSGDITMTANMTLPALSAILES